MNLFISSTAEHKISSAYNYDGIGNAQASDVVFYPGQLVLFAIFKKET